ncbi:MAG: GNAT family N-acetyltransferase [Rickettsiales bacterium]
MKLSFRKFEMSDLDHWYRWAEVPHVKDSWFQEGYEPPEKIISKIKGNGYDHPFVICADDKPIGYIQASNLDEYYKKNPDGYGVFKNDGSKKFCIDLFIAEEGCLNKGIGTELMSKFTKHIFDNYDCKQIFIDPEYSNKRAIRCYEKVGFKFLRFDNDTASNKVYVMRLANH